MLGLYDIKITLKSHVWRKKVKVLPNIRGVVMAVIA